MGWQRGITADFTAGATFTAGASNTLPIWIFGQIRLGQQLPQVNVVVFLILAVTIVPVALAQRLLASNVGRWSQATTGSTRRGEENWVYGRPGRPCRRCGTLIQRKLQGDDERVTFWCPTCQPAHPA